MKYVFDTSALSHAFEDFTHAVVSAYTAVKKPRIGRWIKHKQSAQRRFASEHDVRRMLLDCDRNICMITPTVLEELQKNPQFHDELELLLGHPDIIENEYLQHMKRDNVHGFAETFKPRIIVAAPNPDLVSFIKSIAESYGIDISKIDIHGVALAKQENAILVTGDGGQAKLARLVGVKTIYTFAKQKQYQYY